MFPWEGDISLLNYSGKKVNESRRTVTTDCILRSCFLFRYQKSKGMGFTVSLIRQKFILEILRAKRKRFHTDCSMRLLLRSCLFLFNPNSKGIGFSVSLFKQFFTPELLREKIKRFRTDCNNRLHRPRMSSFLNQSSSSMDLVFQWISNTIELLKADVNEYRVTATTDCTFRPCLPFVYQNSKGNGFSVSLNKQYFTLGILRAKSKRIPIDCNNRLHSSSKSSLLESNIERNAIQCFVV